MLDHKEEQEFKQLHDDCRRLKVMPPPAISFDGWNTEDDGSGDDYAPEASITMTAPTTLYAQWLAD